jgi:hypothetical protein
MAATSQPHGQTPGTHADDPGDVPADRPTSLDRLDVLIEQWEMEATFEAGYFGPGPATTGCGGRTTFEGLEAGSSSLRMILGLIRPDAGTAAIAGKPYTKLASPARTAGALLEAAARPSRPHRPRPPAGARGRGRAPQSPGQWAAGPGRLGPRRPAGCCDRDNRRRPGSPA